MNVIKDYVRISRQDFYTSNTPLYFASFNFSLVQTMDAYADTANIGNTASENDLFPILAGCVYAAQCTIVNFTILNQHFRAREVKSRVLPLAD